MIKTYSTKRAIIDLMIVKEQVVRLFISNEKYKKFIEFIFDKDYLNDNDLNIPSIKIISLVVGLTPPKTTKLIKELYEDFLEKKLKFTEVEIIFFMSYFDKHHQVIIEDIKHLPKIGDQIDMSFVNAKIGTGMHYVNKIEHVFENNTQRIYVSLIAGYFNLYFHYRKSKAFESREISSNDYYSGDDYLIREKLKNFRD
jgi:hypothetical protein